MESRFYRHRTDAPLLRRVWRVLEAPDGSLVRVEVPVYGMPAVYAMSTLEALSLPLLEGKRLVRPRARVP